MLKNCKVATENALELAGKREAAMATKVKFIGELRGLSFDLANNDISLVLFGDNPVELPFMYQRFEDEYLDFTGSDEYDINDDLVIKLNDDYTLSLNSEERTSLIVAFHRIGYDGLTYEFLPNIDDELKAIGKNLDSIDTKFNGKSLNNLLWELFFKELDVMDSDLVGTIPSEEMSKTDFNKFMDVVYKAREERFQAIEDGTLGGLEDVFVEWDGKILTTDANGLEDFIDANDLMCPSFGNSFSKCDTVEKALETLNIECGGIKILQWSNLRAAILFKDFEKRLNELGVKIR